jgi:hypothetical protein
MVHVYQTSSLLPGHLPSLRLLYLLNYSGHISHIQVLDFFPFPYSSHASNSISSLPFLPSQFSHRTSSSASHFQFLGKSWIDWLPEQSRIISLLQGQLIIILKFISKLNHHCHIKEDIHKLWNLSHRSNQVAIIHSPCHILILKYIWFTRIYTYT